MITAISTIVILSTLGIIAYNLKGKMSPPWVKLPAPGAIMVGYWLLFAQYRETHFTLMLILAIGMTVAFLGDTLLAIDFKKNLILGLASFAIGYSCFSGDIICNFNRNASIATSVIAVAILIISFLIFRKFIIEDKVQKIAIPVYYIILSTLVTSASLLSLMALLGAIFLYTCDSIIGLNSFSKPIKGSDGWSLSFYNSGHLLYFLAVHAYLIS